MSTAKPKHKSMPLLAKGLCLVLVAIFLLLGVIGLILPIIPGLLFLFLAALMLAKVSKRFDTMLNRNSNMRYWRRRWDTSSGLPLVERVKLSCWVAARALVNGVEAAVNSVRNTRREG